LVTTRYVIGGTRLTNDATLPYLIVAASLCLKNLARLVKGSSLNNDTFVHTHFNLHNIKGNGGRIKPTPLVTTVK